MTAPSESLGAGEQGDREAVARAIYDALHASSHIERDATGRARFSGRLPGDLADAVLAALDVPALRARIAELEAENERLRGPRSALYDVMYRDNARLAAERDALRAAVERVRALAKRWEQEATERGLHDDCLYTAGVVDMLRAALDEPGRATT